MLTRLVTDYYYGRSIPRLASLGHRRVEGIPAAAVRDAPKAFAAQVLTLAASKVGVSLRHPIDTIEASIASVALREARRSDADLFMYSGYAYESFSALPDRKKLLFKFHPDGDFIRACLNDDDLLSSGSWMPEPEEAGTLRRAGQHARELELADRILCASSFTKSGLVRMGIAPDRIVVVPYGCPEPAEPAVVAEARREGECKILFVGQGVRRKGLHLLLEAWGQLRPKNARLRIIASRIDPAIGAMASNLSSVDLSGPTTREQIVSEMLSADTLVLPSLVEGFGLVIGEALSAGCRIIASTHTGLPDLGLPAEIATVVPAGRIEELVDSLRTAIETFAPGGLRAREATAAAKQRSWAAYRKGIREFAAAS
tara:strand:- start:5793 stop:6905 length:1113 start_codon:yes stop_codon:yes gene_type:complete